MTYQELVYQSSSRFKHMMPDLEKFGSARTGCPTTQVAKAEIIEWEHTVDGDGGLGRAPEIWPVEKFARSLREHQATTALCAATSPNTRCSPASCPKPSPIRSAGRRPK